MNYSRRNALLAIISSGLSNFGGFISMVAFSSFIYITTSSALNVGVFLSCRVLGGVFGSLAANFLFSQFKSVPALCFINLFRFLLVSSLIWMPTNTHPYIFPAIGLLLGASNAMFTAGINSQLPRWVSEDLLIKTNGYMSMISGISIVIGSFISGLIISFFGFHIVFTIACLSYLVSGLSILNVKVKVSEKSLDTPELYAIKSDFSTLFKALKSTPILLLMLIVTLVDTLGSGSHNVGMPIISKLLTPQNPASTMGYILSIWAIGQITGAKLCAIYLKGRTIPYIEYCYFIGVLLMSSGFILAFWQTQLFISLSFFILAGMGDGVAEVSFVTRAQKADPVHHLPLFSAIGLMQQSGFCIGMLISSFMFTVMPVNYVVTLFHGLPILMTVSLIGYITYQKFPHPSCKESINVKE